MVEYQKYINALRKCAKEHENDRTSTGHIIVSNLCEDTANLLEELEQEPILDKIRAEIDGLIKYYPYPVVSPYQTERYAMLRADEVLQIIDKYKAEVEPQKGANE